MIIGTYLHGLFDQADACNALLQWVGYEAGGAVDYAEECEAGIDLIADTLTKYFDFKRLERCYEQYCNR